MFIAIIGTRASGRSSVEHYLVNTKGFLPVRLWNNDSETLEYWGHSRESSAHSLVNNKIPGSSMDQRLSFLQMTSPPPSALPSPAPDANFDRPQPMTFPSSSALLHHVTRNWRTDFVTIDLNTKELLAPFTTRPFFMVVAVDAPLLIRFGRCQDSDVSLEDFVREHDVYYYGTSEPSLETPRNTTFERTVAPPALSHLNEFVDLHIVNSFHSVQSLHAHLDQLNLLDPERLRPGWDAYFMQLATLAARRSNCMKRRVGAILVRNKRILATGYNGTPRGVLNCNDGGCRRCNSASEALDECVCLHAEENALLEAGRERVGDGAVLYCNTCPCLKCTIKIIQTGVKEVVYNLSYKMDDASAALFLEAGVVLRRHATP